MVSNNVNGKSPSPKVILREFWIYENQTNLGNEPIYSLIKKWWIGKDDLEFRSEIPDVRDMAEERLGWHD